MELLEPVTPADAAIALEGLISRIEALPPLPEVAQAILRFGDGSEAGLRGLCIRIQQDVALTARMLRVANSPFYGLQGSVHTLEDALVVLGSATLRAIALTGALIAPFDSTRSLRFDPRRFWQHALASAVLAQRLAQSNGVAPPAAFTAGLLHQIGVLALCTVDPTAFDIAAAEADASGRTFSQSCLALMGWDPCALGAALARRWQLPDMLSEAVAEWRTPPAGRQLKADRQLADIVHLADRLAHLLPSLPTDPWPRDCPQRLEAVLALHPLDPGVTTRLALEPARLLAMLPPAARELERLAALLA